MLYQKSPDKTQTLELLFQAVLEKRADKAVVEAAKPYSDEACPEDVAYLIDLAISRGVGLEILKPGVSKLLNLLYDPLRGHRYPGGNVFLDSLMEENRGAVELLTEAKSVVATINATARLHVSDLARIRSFAEGLGALEIHYLKKENILFPAFEAKYPEYRCVQLMWSIHDDVRRSLRHLRELCDDAESLVSEINGEIGRLYFNIHAVIFREECIIFPILAKLFDKTDLDSLFEESRAFGFCFLDDAKIQSFVSRSSIRIENREPDTEDACSESSVPVLPRNTELRMETGALTMEVLQDLFRVLPVDMTFVDAAGRVAWFSNGPHRIFPRSPSIIGRDVRNCHPRESLDRVVSILEDFRAGRRDRAAFWLQLRGRFIHIEYFALHTPEGRFLGTLEVSQDLTEKRALQGEKRL